MKERTFYTINLDIRRIAFIVIVLVGLLSYFFMLGNAMGKKSVATKDASVSENVVNDISTSEKSDIKPSTEENIAEEKSDSKEAEIVDLKPSTDITKPIPVPVSPVVEVKEDLSKKMNQTNTNLPEPKKTVPIAPVKKPTYVNTNRKSLSAKTPIVLEEKNFYTIQLGAFSSQEQANKFKDKVATKNKFPGKLVPYVLKQRDFFVVRVGKSTIKEDLEKIVQNLDGATQGSAMIIKNNKP